ncbi:unnamed protein product, partial [Nippostrongylus brasiliensis]|uniref:C2H2-type domain-containing protein n=1 Tax=Nippostrongylus brasiliensis TaxID=27835 RepID=A0A0N4XHQ3_NIPBR
MSLIIFDVMLIRCFTKPKFEVKEEEVEEKPKPVVCDLKEQLVIPAVSPAVIGDRILAQQISIITDSTPEKPKTNEFCCNLCPYGASTRSNLIRHEAKHQIKDLFKCPHCTFSGRTLEFIEKHRRLHQTVAAISTSTASPSSPQIHMPPMVLVPVSTVPPSLVSLPHSAAPLITVSLPARGQITMAANNRLPLTFASVIQDQSVIPSIPSTPPSVKVDEDSAASTPTEQKPKCPPRRSATEPSLRFIGSDGVKRRRCPLCPYVSKFSCDMRSHMEMHTMNARFKCSQCSYSTKRAVSLRSHIALHTEENAIKA